jgi:lipopolysaccharide/colanic/teichoic acid biosynthesis glycosyltransferase
MISFMENWSILLDIKIIFLTIYNTIRGDKKHIDMKKQSGINTNALL